MKSLISRKFSILPEDVTWVRVPVQGMAVSPMLMRSSPTGAMGTSLAMMSRTFLSRSARSMSGLWWKLMTKPCLTSEWAEGSR